MSHFSHLHQLTISSINHFQLKLLPVNCEAIEYSFGAFRLNRLVFELFQLIFLLFRCHFVFDVWSARVLHGVWCFGFWGFGFILRVGAFDLRKFRCWLIIGGFVRSMKRFLRFIEFLDFKVITRVWKSIPYYSYANWSID